jgi:hypothetical protein
LFSETSTTTPPTKKNGGKVHFNSVFEMYDAGTETRSPNAQLKSASLENPKPKTDIKEGFDDKPLLGDIDVTLGVA